MSFAEAERSMFYPEDYDYSIFKQNEFENYASDLNQSKNPADINYLKERKCPIYVHHIRNDMSVANNYNQKLTTPRKYFDYSKNQQNASKFVLDKLEETYWATWKPKKQNMAPKRKNSPKISNFGFLDAKPDFKIHNKGIKRVDVEPHGDVNDNIFKYFKAKNFESSSTAPSVTFEEFNTNTFLKSKILSESTEKVSEKSSTLFSIVNEANGVKSSLKKAHKPRNRITEKKSISQEIQTEVHCPVILEETKLEMEGNKKMEIIYENEENKDENGSETLEALEKETNGNIDEERKEIKHHKNGDKDEKIVNNNKHNIVEKINNKKSENKVKPKTKKLKKSSNKQEQIITTETEENENQENHNSFLDHKDSVELVKEKMEKSVPIERYQQPRCIRLYRKSISTSGYMKGGSYPLKYCLKKEGNFRLGAPGSPIFITTSSFSNKKGK